MSRSFKSAVITFFACVIFIAGCSDNKSTTSGALDATAAKCFTDYVDGYTGLANAYQGVSESQDKAEWGKNHYESQGYKEGRALPDGCVAYLKNTNETWIAYVDSYPDLKATYEAQKASLAKTSETETKARWGENHYKTVGFKESRSLPRAASGLGLGNPPPPSVKVSGSTPGAEAEEVAEAEAEPESTPEAVPTVTLACATASISEDGGTSECTLTLSKTYSQAVTVTVAYSGSATAGTDYSGNTTSHTISAGSTTTSWTITGLNDNSGGGGGDNGESDETIVVDIASVTNGTEQDTQTASISLPNICIAPGQAINNNTDFGNAITDWFASPSGASATYGDITQWCTGNVTNMSWKFFAKTFNEDISGWDVSNVTNMERMLAASSFNRSLNSWDVSSVENMKDMFSDSAFNGDISGWNTSSVTSMEAMFRNTSAFNGNIGNWNVSAVSDMEDMFKQATAFNQDIGSWNVSNVTNMNEVFQSAPAFNQDVSGWDTGSVTDMGWMFANYSGGATAFNQNLSGWNVSSLTRCTGISTNATSWTNSSLKPGGLCAGQ
ncbi:BspA family leucine-rich repeat surface protein [Gammaproteobacteria bacterium]|nr:BspA family leucine-rich repeat surface protein [Gammaproteobacteria bacterium]